MANRIVAQSGDGIEELAAVPKRGDAKLLQVLRRQVRQDRLVYVIPFGDGACAAIISGVEVFPAPWCVEFVEQQKRKG